jgi:hypothetical protein
MNFKPAIFAAIAVGLTATAADAAGKIFNIALQNFTVTDGIGEVTVKTTNKTGKFVSHIAIRCDFKDQGGKIVDVGWRRNLSLAAGKTDLFKVRGKTSMGTVKSANCNLTFY